MGGFCVINPRIEVLPELVFVFATREYKVEREDSDGYLCYDPDMSKLNSIIRFKVITSLNNGQIRLLNIAAILKVFASEVQDRFCTDMVYDKIIMSEHSPLGNHFYRLQQGRFIQL